MEPSPYSGHTVEELEAINIFEGYLIPKSVIPHISRLDKVPNTDGHVEILDDQKRPVAKLEIQVKKIPDGDTSFSCPIELVAYSERISLPFLLICVDTRNRRAYFKHLHARMPEIKVGQKTFTVHFDPKVNAVAPDSQFVNQWLELSKEYTNRIADYPRLNEIVNQLDPSHVSKQDKIYFQEFIEHINRFLDYELCVVKDRYFRGIWKLGAAVYSADATEVCFQLYSIAPGDPDIRVTGISSQPSKPSQVPPDAVSAWLQGRPGSTAIQYNWINRSHLKPARKQAEEFIMKHVEKMLRQKTFSIHGRNLATEYLFWFVDEYGHTIGVEPADRLSVAELNYGISVYLPAWVSLAAPRCRGELIKLNRNNLQAAAQLIANLSFESTARVWPPNLRPSKEEVQALIASGAELRPCPLCFHDVSIYSLMECVDYLLSEREAHIERPYKQHSSPPRFIGSGYKVDELRFNVGRILTWASEGYRAFIDGNGIKLKKSIYLAGIQATIYLADLNTWSKGSDFFSSPMLNIYVVENSDKSLPANSLVDVNDPERPVREGEFLLFGGAKRKIIRSVSGSGADLFKDLPLREMIYEMLREDLADEYEYDFT
jgi:hypothetical protein